MMTTSSAVAQAHHLQHLATAISATSATTWETSSPPSLP